VEKSTSTISATFRHHGATNNSNVNKEILFERSTDADMVITQKYNHRYIAASITVQKTKQKTQKRKWFFV